MANTQTMAGAVDFVATAIRHLQGMVDDGILGPADWSVDGPRRVNPTWGLATYYSTVVNGFDIGIRAYVPYDQAMHTDSHDWIAHLSIERNGQVLGWQDTDDFGSPLVALVRSIETLVAGPLEQGRTDFLGLGG